jgi:hypothetical protein
LHIAVLSILYGVLQKIVDLWSDQLSHSRRSDS